MTVASSTADFAGRGAAPSPQRGLGLLAIATGIAGFALLASHPGGDAHSFADVLKDEAGNRVMDAVVHGGFIVVLALQMVCYAAFSARLGLQRVAPLAALVFFAMGAVFLSGSMVLDGLATPAIAAKYLAAPNKIEYAKSLFVLVGTLISFLMPIGLAFQSAAIAAWGWALVASGSRLAGAFGIVVGGLLVIALSASVMTMNPFVLMGAIAMTAVWALVAGVWMLRR